MGTDPGHRSRKTLFAARAIAVAVDRRALLAAGGLLIIAGTFWPEIGGAARWTVIEATRLFRPARPDAEGSNGSTEAGAETRWTGLSQSNWIVIKEAIDTIVDPGESPPPGMLAFCAVKVGGLSYPVLAGLVFGLAAFLPRSRAAAIGCYLFHMIAMVALAGGALVLASSILGMVEAGDADGARVAQRQAFGIAGAAALLGGLALVEMGAAGRGARRAASGMFLVDAVNLPPAAFLLVLNAVLYALLARNPMWPSGGYLVAAYGALLAVAGTVRSRRPRAGRGHPVTAGGPAITA